MKSDLGVALFERVDRSRGSDACWEWTGNRSTEGYGRFSVSPGVYRYAHRLIFREIHGFLPEAVCHSCDNPPCCNPAHLWAGTSLENNRDRERKGRGKPPMGELNGWARLTDGQVIEAREKYKAGGVTQSRLAKEYGVSFQHMSDLLAGKSWGHLPAFYSPKAKKRLTKEERAAVRQMRGGGISAGELAKAFSVSHSTITKASGEFAVTRLTNDQIITAKRLLAEGINRAEIGKLCGIRRSTLSNIALGKNPKYRDL